MFVHYSKDILGSLDFYGHMYTPIHTHTYICIHMWVCNVCVYRETGILINNLKTMAY